jgi:hypothetical protein
VLELPCDKTGKSDYLNAINKKSFSEDELEESERINGENMCLWYELRFERARWSDSLRVLLPVGNKDHEIIVLIVTLVVVTFLAFSVAKWVRKKVRSIKCNVNKHDDEDDDSDIEQNERKRAKTKNKNGGDGDSGGDDEEDSDYSTNVERQRNVNTRGEQHARRTAW